MKSIDLNDAYYKLLNRVYNGPSEVNARTGVRTKVIPGAQTMSIDLRDRQLPVFGNRAYFPGTAAAEVAWQFQYTQDPAFIMKHAPTIWKKFIEDDRLLTAYGYRWEKHFGRQQISMAVEELRNNPTNRQLFISAWDPTADGLGGPDQPKNIPCPVGFTVNVTEGRLNMAVFMRSSDVFVGLPYDIMGYSLTMAAMAESAGLKCGILHFTLAHAHLYEPHFKAAQECLTGTKCHWTSRPTMDLPIWTIDEIQADPDTYVFQVKRAWNHIEWNNWNPKPEVVE